MVATGKAIQFSNFMELFRRRGNNERGVDEQVESLVSLNGQSLKECLVMDRSPGDEKEFLVFDALVSSGENKRLDFARSLDATCIPPLISRIEKGTLELVALAGMPLSGALATDIFEKLLNIDLRWFAIYLRKDYDSEIFRPFRHFIQQESSIRSLSLCCHPDDWISMEALQSICTGIISSSVKFLRLVGLKVRGENVERVHEILAEMILDSSSSIERVKVTTAVPGDISLLMLSRAFRQHSVIQNLDISFRTLGAEGQQDDTLDFDRNPWWKRLLAIDDLPLSMWPLLLEKADTWKRDACHSHLDVLYFLLREKNTELLQNVRRRRIRKRKRYGLN